MGTYVTDSGFKGRSVSDEISTLNAGLISLFGANTDTDPLQPNGMFIGLHAAMLAECWDALAEVYASVDPNSASGLALDRVVAIYGLSRIAAAASTVPAILYTDTTNLGCTIPSGSEARRVRGALVFSLSSALTIAAASCQDIYLKLAAAPTAGATLSLATTFGTFSITVPSIADATARTIAAYELLAAAIVASSWATTASNGYTGTAQVWNSTAIQYPTSDTVGGCQVSSGVFLRLTHMGAAFGVTPGSWTVVECGAQGTMVCSSTGANSVAAGELSEIVTPQTGWVGVYNLIAGTAGRLEETDSQLRIRYAAAANSGSGTEAAILKAVLNDVAGITSASIASNRASSTDSAGRPGHSFEVTAIGGSDADVAAAIFKTMPAGIQAYGSTSVTVTDSAGNTHTIGFSRPTALTVYVKVEYATYAKESFPSDGQAQIIAAVVAYIADNLGAGKDVFADRIKGAIYDAVTGIGAMTVTVSEDNSTWTSYLAIAGRYYASTSSSNVTVAAA